MDMCFIIYRWLIRPLLIFIKHIKYLIQCQLNYLRTSRYRYMIIIMQVIIWVMCDMILWTRDEFLISHPPLVDIISRIAHVIAYYSQCNVSGIIMTSYYIHVNIWHHMDIQENQVILWHLLCIRFGGLILTVVLLWVLFMKCHLM